jgi:hypothetical protein
MMTSLTNLTRFGFVLLTLLVWVHPGGVAASGEYTVTEPTDFYFTIAEASEFTVRTFSTNDPMLWLYGPDGGLVAENDDFYGLDSRISVYITGIGTYRLRAGVCCGNPEAWRGSSYTLTTNLTAGSPTTTAAETTTTWLPTTTSTEPTTTTSTTVPETTVPVTTEVSTSQRRLPSSQRRRLGRRH